MRQSWAVMGVLVVSAGLASAGDITDASVTLTSVSTSSLSWSSLLLIIGFVLSVGMLALSRFIGDLKGIVAVPITFIVIGAVLRAYPLFLGAPAIGATLPPERMPVERFQAHLPVDMVPLP